MNRYPIWKYTLIAIVLLVSALYTLPNFFGEVPALQVSPVRATLKADAALLQKATDALAQAKIAPQAAVVEGGSLRLRFSDTDIQLRAKDVIERAVGDGYIVALNLVSNSPAWLSAINALPMYLGLDLRGGVHFLLQVDMKAAVGKQLDGYVTDVRNRLREEKIGSAGIAREGQTLVIRFRDAGARDKALALLGKAIPDLLLREVDEGSEARIVATARPEAVKRSMVSVTTTARPSRMAANRSASGTRQMR